MITCDFHGRLGNNLFQIATVISLAKKVNADFIFPEYTWAGHRGRIPVDLDIFDYQFNRGDYRHEKEYHESRFEYDQIKPLDDLKIAGFFQSYQYFDEIKNELIEKYFKPNKSISERVSSYEISKNSLGISVRRGDYLMLQNNHCVLSTDYYQNAINDHFQNSVDQIFVFSDDLNWCKSIFGNDVTYVEDSIGVQLFLMAKIKNLILSNSTFAWWGGYLNQQNGTIVIPDPWFGVNNRDKDTSGLYYHNWIKYYHDIVFQ